MITPFETKNAVDGTPLKGVIYRPDNAVAVINLVHGFGEHSGRYLHMMDALGEQGIAVAAIDLRGHGKSGGKRGVCRKYDLMHSDVEALLAQSAAAFPELPHILFGHSMGGGLVLNHVLTRGQQGISAVIASAPLLMVTDPPPMILDWLLRCMRRILPDMTINNAIGGDKISTIPEEQALYEKDALNHGKLGAGLAIDMIDAGAQTLLLAEDWNAPLLLLHAENDKLTRFSASRYFASLAANCSFRAFSGSEHEMHNDVCRDRIYHEITTFVQGQL